MESLLTLLPLFDSGSGTFYDLRHLTMHTAPKVFALCECTCICILICICISVTSPCKLHQRYLYCLRVLVLYLQGDLLNWDPPKSSKCQIT